jgi:23S rRNA pseudouridine1911/1915/1917 synthase
VVSDARSFTVLPEEAGERLDRFLVRRCPELGRRGAASLIERGLVNVGGRRESKGFRVRAGDVVGAPLDFGFAPASEVAPLDVRLERADLVVVDKPAGQPTAPLAPGEAGTLTGALLARYPEMRGIGYREREPGIVHRLDTRTSGLVIAARSALAFEVLRDALRAHRLDKRYLAIVEAAGLPDEVCIELPLALEPGGSGRVVALASAEVKGATPCSSVVRVLERRGRFALVDVTASRAFRHQVRVHLSASGWPIAGDREYGGARREALAARHALHASHVAWAGDERVPAFAVDSPLPADLEAFFAAGSGLGGADISDSSS